MGRGGGAAVRPARRGREQRRGLRDRADHRPGGRVLGGVARHQRRRFFHLAKATLPLLAEVQGTLVAVSSVSGDRGDWGQSAYNATKAVITNFVRSLALDWGPRGVRPNAVAPSFTVTELTERLGEDERVLAAFANRIALGRPAQPDDIAPAVLFLASEGARNITGAVLPVDGGTSASTGPAASLGPPRPVLRAIRELLHRPGVAVRVAEVDEGSPVLLVDVADRDAAAEQILARRLDVRDDDLQALLRARSHLGDAGADHDGAGRARRRELHEAQRPR